MFVDPSRMFSVTITRRDFLSATSALIAGAVVQRPGKATPATAISSPAQDASAAWTLPAQRPFRVIENDWIPISDGTKLAVRLWLPEGADRTPVPVVLEYLPYRKRDDIRKRDNTTALNLAPYGIAFARVDIRGTGDSGGVMTDEYARPELEDGVECIAWLAKQVWCNGNVGMRGISWGGINSLQIAAMSPPALKAIMPMGCVDNRFLQDAHYIGGSLAMENFKWGTYFKVIMGSPPDPQISGPNWEKQWQERLLATPTLLKEWTSHQRYDEYWQRGSVAVDYSLIKCPVYVVSGWLDPYTEAVGTLLTGLQVPRKALIGPWGHQMPNLPAPMHLGWAHEEVRWWQQWLQGVDTGIMDEPMFRAFMPYQTLSEVYPAEIPGRWIAESTWPPPDRQLLELHLGRDILTPTSPESTASLTLVGDRIVGQCKPHWMPSLADDQQPDDKKSLVFDSGVLHADTEILGYPIARIRVSANVPVAKLVVRLTEVLPDGKSWLVSYGILNLTHRDSHEHPTPLTAGEFYDVEVSLYMVAHRFKKGSRIRAAISETMWPMVWPSPAIATLTIDPGSSSLILPVRNAPPREAAFSIPVNRVGGSSSYFHAGKRIGTEVTFESPLERTSIPDIDTVMETHSCERLMLKEDDPSSCFWSQENTTAWKRQDWDCTVGAAFELKSTAEEFSLKEVLWAKKGDREIFRREQSSTIKRDLL